MDLESFKEQHERGMHGKARVEERALDTSRSDVMPITDERTRANWEKVDSDITKAKKDIAEARRARGEPDYQKNEKVLETITKALKKRGTFYQDDLRSYLFLTDKRSLIPIDPQEEPLELVLNEYGLNPVDRTTSYVIEGLRLYARTKGETTATHAFAHYDRSQNVVYAFDFSGGMFRISSEGLVRVDNGTDGVLFLQNRRCARINLYCLRPTVDWPSWLLSGLRFLPGTLSEREQHLLFAVWVLALFFPDLFPTRIVLALIGEKGSGKSSLLRRVGQLLFGRQFNVSALTQKSDDFEAAITTDPFVVADNADDAPRWFTDKLAVVATGGTIKRRMLYTTNRVGEYPIVATVAVTSRTPNFTREDVAERLLPLSVGRLEPFRPEGDLLDEVASRRSEVLEAVLRDVWRAVKELGKPKDQVFRTGLRMADFAAFAMKVAPVLNSTPEEMVSILKRLSGQQVALSAQDEPLLDLIDQWLADDTVHVNIEREVAAFELARELESVAGGRPVPWDRGNPRSFSQYLRVRKGTLTSCYGLTERSGHGGATTMRFSHRRNGGLGDLGDGYKPYSVAQDEYQEG